MRIYTRLTFFSKTCYIRYNKMKILDKTPFNKTTTPVEVKKGTLVLLHGRLPHYSKENISSAVFIYFRYCLL